MALIACSECGRQISSRAAACPHCGAPTGAAADYNSYVVLGGYDFRTKATLFGLPLVPFWGVWAERYGRIPIIARSAFVEMAVFGLLWLSQNRWEAAFAILLVGFQLGNTGVMLTALRAAAPQGRVGFVISLFGVSPSLGFALGPAAGGWLVDHNVLNLHTLFAADAALSLASGAMLLAFAREGVRPPASPGWMPSGFNEWPDA